MTESSSSLSLLVDIFKDIKSTNKPQKGPTLKLIVSALSSLTENYDLKLKRRCRKLYPLKRGFRIYFLPILIVIF